MLATTSSHGRRRTMQTPVCPGTIRKLTPARRHRNWKCPNRQQPQWASTPHQTHSLHNNNENAREGGKKNVHREASGALHVHEERVGRLYKPLQLVLLGLDRGVGVKQVTLQSLCSTHTQTTTHDRRGHQASGGGHRKKNSRRRCNKTDPGQHLGSRGAKPHKDRAPPPSGRTPACC